MDNNFNNYKKRFVKKATLNGFSADNISKCLDYSEPIINNGVPVIYNTSHLSALVGYNKNYLKRAVFYTRYFYRYFKIEKDNGKKRTISEPLPNLKDIQNWILNEILYKIKISRYAKAYVPNRSIKDHVRYHTNEKYVLTLDIENFFGSINFYLTEDIFKNLGYSNLISNLLTKLCYLNGSLPQGAPTSPAISNIIMYEFDVAMSVYCREQELKYTRYADDLAFSGDFNQESVIEKVQMELKKIGLILNVDKTRFMPQSQPQIICGIVVNKKIQVPKYKRNQIRQEMYYIKKFDLKSHMERTKQKKDNYLKHLIGSINYILIMNPKDNEFIEYRKHLYSLEKPVGNNG